MRFSNYLNELTSDYGAGITFCDVDDCLFYTFAKIKVIKDGREIRELTNQEFNTYELKDGETFDFGEFRNAEFFSKTSIPIEKTINRIKRMFKNMDQRGSRVVLLTARADFDDKETFLNTFRKHGIPIDSIYVERAGNMKTGTVSSKKKTIIMKYLSSGMYRRCRLIDDDITNLKDFLKIEKELPQAVINKIVKQHNIRGEEGVPVIEFFALHVQENGALKRIK
jgi:hypothetical protein